MEIVTGMIHSWIDVYALWVLSREAILMGLGLLVLVYWVFYKLVLVPVAHICGTLEGLSDALDAWAKRRFPRTVAVTNVVASFTAIAVISGPFVYGVWTTLVR
jgi:hypothetical protein